MGNSTCHLDVDGRDAAYSRVPDQQCIDTSRVAMWIRGNGNTPSWQVLQIRTEDEMKEIKVRIPTLDDMTKFDEDQLQSLLVPENEAKELAEEGIGMYLVKNSKFVAPDGKTALLNFYIVLGSEEDLKKTLKYYYPQ